MRTILILSMFASSVLTALAAESEVKPGSTSLDFAQVTYVTATQALNGSWCFDVTVRHNDQGWKHYADAWEVLDLNGNRLGYRSLAHPHDNEQPFTRRQCNILIPKEISKVIVRAKCNKHGFGKVSVTVDLSKNKGRGYSVKRAN